MNINLENWIAPLTAIEQAIAEFTPISLAEIGEAALLDRVETKYVVSAELLPAFVNGIRADYGVLSIAEQRLNHYRTLYFDSADFILYRRHHAGAANRYKVRARQYVETGANFLEVKRKDNKRRTHKKRCMTDSFVRVIDRPYSDFLRQHYPHNLDELYGRLLSNYRRITLVNHHTAERVTIDLELSFEWEETTIEMENVAIIEIKCPPRSAESRAVAQLRKQHLRPQRFSKYCIGVTQLYPHIKHNNFKPTLRHLNKLAQGSSYAY